MQIAEPYQKKETFHEMVEISGKLWRAEWPQIAQEVSGPKVPECIARTIFIIINDKLWIPLGHVNICVPFFRVLL